MAVLLMMSWPAPAAGQTRADRGPGARCDFSDVPGAVWWGPQQRMTVEELATYMAPVYWFSPDEPLLERAEGEDIRIPEALPFEEAPDRPVVYYQLDELILRGEGAPAFLEDRSDKGASVIDLGRVATLEMGFFAYFRAEEGLHAHPHDVEATELRATVLDSTDEYIQDLIRTRCDEPYYVLSILRVTAKAHGLIWYWNVLDVDAETRFPFHLFVEEGKHGLATDKNADGYFTPGYDVTRHINDAWGVRDVIRSGLLFTGGYQGWMTKVRHPEHRVLPPVPADSVLRERLARRGYYQVPYIEYELRPFPPASLSAYDRGLYRFVEDKAIAGWPEVETAASIEDVLDWIDEGVVIKSLSMAFRTDGEPGFSFVFPLFIVKNFEDPLSGGFVVHRVYFKDVGLRDFGWMLMYTPSASRWVDTYVAAGAEWSASEATGVQQGAVERTRDVDFVLETGLKFRADLSRTRLGFLSVLTDFWGIRLGVQSRGFFDIDEMTYVFEIGAGAW